MGDDCNVICHWLGAYTNPCLKHWVFCRFNTLCAELFCPNIKMCLHCLSFTEIVSCLDAPTKKGKDVVTCQYEDSTEVQSPISPLLEQQICPLNQGSFCVCTQLMRDSVTV